MKAKNEEEFTTIRVKKKTADTLRKMCAQKLISSDKVVHPYEIIEEMLNPTIKNHAI